MIQFDEAYLSQLERYGQSASALTRRERYLALLNPLPGQRILDLGCGSGDLSRVLAPLVAPGGRVTGVDLSQDAVALATRLSAGIEPEALSFERGDGHALRFADGAFDAAACIDVLGFCRDPGHVLSELRRVLQEGGLLLLAESDERMHRYSGSDGELSERVNHAIAARGCDPGIAERLMGMLQESGYRVLEEEVLAGVERHYSPGAAGYTLAHALRDYLLGRGLFRQTSTSAGWPSWWPARKPGRTAIARRRTRSWLQQGRRGERCNTSCAAAWTRCSLQKR